MVTVLLDTSVASLFIPGRKERPERSFYETRLKGHTLALSFQSVAELWRMAEKNEWQSKRREALESFLQRFLVIPYDYELTKVWARITAEAERKGRRMEAGDAWIAATAVHRALPLYAHDRDFLGLDISGLAVVSALEG